MISLMLDQHLLYSEPFTKETFVSDKDVVKPTGTDIGAVAGGGAREDDLENPGIFTTLTSLDEAWEVSNPWYVDQIRPFDVVIVAANEYGQAASMRIYGIEILNEGSGFSIDDIVIENQMTYVARTILPWQKLGSWSDAGGTLGSFAGSAAY